ncbi:hypothetical protein BDC45DRAFT_516150 [Circinella umbellata]|nr:hypothetical protein BDC45DRAFT_516150 [Circinella umbellata]
MSRTTASDTSSTSRSHVFPFRSRTAPEPQLSSSSMINNNSNNNNGRPPRIPKPNRKLKNSLFRFNKDQEADDDNQTRQLSTPTAQANRHPRSDTSEHEDDEDDDDDYSDNGTVQPGQGCYTLRVINPDPESSDEEEEEKKERIEQKNNLSPSSTALQKHTVTQQPPLALSKQQQQTTSATLRITPVEQEHEPCPVKLEISEPPLPVPQHDSNGKSKSTGQFVTSFLSTAPSPTASSLSLLTSSSRGGSEGLSEGPGSRTSVGDDNNNIIHNKNQTELVRRESKTLEEHVVLGPPPIIEEEEKELDNYKNNNAVLEEGGLLVASPAALTPQTTSPTGSRRHSGTSANKFMPPPSQNQPLFVATPHNNDSRAYGFTSLSDMRNHLSPSIGESGILPSISINGNRSIATTANESVLTATMTRAPQSKYSKASYSLTNNREALKLYREMAEKTNDKEVQLNYANYLLEISQLYDKNHNDQQQQQQQNQNQSQQQQRGHHRGTGSLSISMNRRQSRDSSITMDGRLNDMMKRGRASLNGPIRNIRPLLSLESDNSMDNQEKKRILEEEGVRWIKRLAKEEVGEAAFMLATWMDEEKYGCRSNPLKSFKLYEIAARKGKPEAMYAVAQYHERHGNETEALASYKAAAEKGLVASVLRLAQVNLHGELSQRQNMITSLALLAQAAENSNKSYPEPICVFAQVLANIYPRADIPAELVQPYGGANAAKGWFERGAEFGHAKCHSQLGYMYEHGLFGVPVDMSQSFHYYESAAHLGDAEGMLGLSRLYNEDRHGPDDTEDRMERDVSQWLIGIGRNEDASYLWCSRAAELGLDEALFLLGWYNEQGFGTPRNLEQAQLCYRRAAAKGHHAAKERLQSTSFALKQHENATSASHRGLQDNRREQACTIM